MRFLFWFSLLILAPLGILILLMAIMISPVPSVAPASALSVDDLARARVIIKQLGLRHLEDGEKRRVLLSQRDLNAGLNYLLSRTPGLSHAAGDVALHRTHLSLRTSIPLPALAALPGPRYLNVQLQMLPELHPESRSELPPDADRNAKRPGLIPTQLRLGSVPMPDAVLRALTWIVLHGVEQLPHYGQQLAIAKDMLQRTNIVTTRKQPMLALDFVWQGTALKGAMQGDMGLDEEALAAYRKLLAQRQEREFRILMSHVFQLAQQRSTENAAIQENRAALTALAERALGRQLGRQSGHQISSLDRAPNPATAKPAVRLAGRTDFAQHFSLSAFITGTGGTELSDLAGVYKEMRDASGGSGFSFNDMAANRAGTVLGDKATRSESEAHATQALLARAKSDSVFFPKVDDLPEFMSKAEFERRYGGIDAPAYRAMMQKIDARIAALAAYR
jgi:hypothetical protein